MVKLKQVAWIPDCHHPYVDRVAWRAMVKALYWWRPDTIAILGDFADFYACSFHDKDKGRKLDLDWEIEETVAALEELQEIGADQKIFLAGNHEHRYNRYLASNAPHIGSKAVRTIPELLELKRLGWLYVPYKSFRSVGKVYMTHDCGHAGKNATAQTLATFQDNIVHGHTHRLQYRIEGNAKGIPHVAASFGWLGDKSKVDYMHKVKANRDWAHGFGIGYMEPETNHIHIRPIPIVGGKCVIEGMLFDGSKE